MAPQNVYLQELQIENGLDVISGGSGNDEFYFTEADILRNLINNNILQFD